MKPLLKDWFKDLSILTIGILIGIFAGPTLLKIAVTILAIVTIGTSAKAIHLSLTSPPRDVYDPSGAYAAIKFVPYARVLAITMPCLLGIGLVKLIACFL